ncbi:unnamed protein product [Parnassius mnemosyne]|uniref:Uncharacterized protein n=1 Tax=Parnassius mnemosyne TaxID=213953 RepID=A0AAV1M2H2_9NEOP
MPIDTNIYTRLKIKYTDALSPPSTKIEYLVSSKKDLRFSAITIRNTAALSCYFRLVFCEVPATTIKWHGFSTYIYVRHYYLKITDNRLKTGALTTIVQAK